MHFEGLDELDNKILGMIKDNARMSYSDIEALDLSMRSGNCLHRVLMKLWRSCFVINIA